jgi:hypothetical protein
MNNILAANTTGDLVRQYPFTKFMSGPGALP